MKKPNATTADIAIGMVGKVLWAIILVPLLAVSAYSLYYVARHLGVPAPFAACFSACFDGVALLSARYALLYAQAGLAGSFPRMITWVAAGLAAFVQTLHVSLGGEPRAAALLWASLPISAVTVYEIHIRWARRHALAKGGRTYPAPLPAFGLVTWILFPINAVKSMRVIVRRRKDSILSHTLKRPSLAIAEGQPIAGEVVDREAAPSQGAKVRLITDARKPTSHSPKAHIRAWARSQGISVSDRARLPRWVEEKYHAEQERAAEHFTGAELPPDDEAAGE